MLSAVVLSTLEIQYVIVRNAVEFGLITNCMLLGHPVGLLTRKPVPWYEVGSPERIGHRKD